VSGYLPERGQQPAPGLRPAPVPRTSLPTKPPPSSSTSRNDKLLATIATLTADLAAERAISDELFACTYASLESGRLERARDAWREARRER